MITKNNASQFIPKISKILRNKRSTDVIIMRMTLEPKVHFGLDSPFRYQRDEQNPKLALIQDRIFYPFAGTRYYRLPCFMKMPYPPVI